MKWPWRWSSPDSIKEVKTVLPEAVALCIRRILEEKKTQCKYSGVPFQGMTLEEISKEVYSRMGTTWTMEALKKSGLKL